jgi:hypothetical protein
VSELHHILDRMDFEAQLKVKKQEAPSLPDKFVSFDSRWRTFSKGLMDHFKVVWGCMNIPLVYVFRAHESPMEVMFYAAYEDSDQHLMTCVVLQGIIFAMKYSKTIQNSLTRTM